MTVLVAILEKASQVPICLEELPLTERIKTEGYSLKLTQGHLRNALDSLTNTYPEYQWEFDVDAKMVNIFPKAEARLSWTIKSVRIKLKTFRELLLGNEDFLGLKEHDIEYYVPWGNLAWLERPVEIYEKEFTIRQALNRLCSFLPWRAKWELTDSLRFTPIGLTYNVRPPEMVIHSPSRSD